MILRKTALLLKTKFLHNYIVKLTLMKFYPDGLFQIRFPWFGLFHSSYIIQTVEMGIGTSFVLCSLSVIIPTTTKYFKNYRGL